MDISDGFIKAMQTGGKLSVRSALNPVLWMCGIITAPGMLISAFVNPPIWFIVMIFIPLGLASVGFVFLLFVDRDKLQSEKYQIEKQTLEMSQNKGDVNPKIIDSDSTELIEETEFTEENA